MTTYLHDNKISRRNKNKLPYILALIFLIGILVYFRSPIFTGLSYISNIIFKPVLSTGNEAADKLGFLGAFFTTHSSLTNQIENLRLELAKNNASMQNYNVLLDENKKLKEILGRKNKNQNFILSGVLSKPNKSLYDTLLIDAGQNEGIIVGRVVYGLGNVPIGRVTEVYPATSKVILFSSPGEKTEVVLSGKDIFAEIVGRGGGNFEVTLPREIALEPGTALTLPGITPYVVAIAEATISDPRDAFTKVLLVSPVNIFELKFVEVER